MKTFIFLFALLPNLVVSQSITFENESGYHPHSELNNDLTKLAGDSLIPKLVYVSKIIGKDNDLNRLYWAMHNASTSKRANIYNLIRFEMDSVNHNFICEWKLYYANDSIRDLNFRLINNNTVYVFSNNKAESKFKVNGKKQILMPNRYYSQTLKKGETAKINKGGLTGMTFWFTWKESGENRYLGVGGGSLGSAAMNPMYGNPSVGLSVTTGSFEVLDRPYGAFLALIYKASKN